MNVIKGYAPLNNARIYYETAGAGRPIIMLHGFSLDTRMWDDQFLPLMQQYKMVRYDLRGFGRSDCPTGESYSHAEDLRHLMDFLDIPRAVIMGCSRGGRWAIEFALDFPKYVDAVVTVDAMPTGFQRLANRPSAIKQDKKTQDCQALKEAWYHHPIFDSARTKSEVAQRLHDMISNYSGWHWFNEDPVRFSKPFAVHRLNQIEAPTLIMVGEKDLDLFVKAADYLDLHIPHSEKSIFRNAGHIPNMESPLEFNQRIDCFLRSEKPGRK